MPRPQARGQRVTLSPPPPPALPEVNVRSVPAKGEQDLLTAGEGQNNTRACATGGPERSNGTRYTHPEANSQDHGYRTVDERAPSAYYQPAFRDSRSACFSGCIRMVRLSHGERKAKFTVVAIALRMGRTGPFVPLSRNKRKREDEGSEGGKTGKKQLGRREGEGRRPLGKHWRHRLRESQRVFRCPSIHLRTDAPLTNLDLALEKESSSR